MSRQCISLLLSTAMLTGLYGVQAEAASGLTYSLRAEQQVFYTAQLSSQDISLTVAMQIAEDPGTAGILCNLPGSMRRLGRMRPWRSGGCPLRSHTAMVAAGQGQRISAG